MPNPITTAQRDALLQTLEARFARTMPYHPDMRWQAVEQSLQAEPGKLASLYRMEETGGEPNVVADPQRPDRIVFFDCAAESPEGRRSLCYDHEALASRKQNAPADSALHMAQTMGAELLSEAQYRALQQLGDFDRKTSSWILTPAAIRALGGALFCDKRYGHVFTYHNGADSYYAARGFRASLAL
jgi:hypothetical protein